MPQKNKLMEIIDRNMFADIFRKALAEYRSAGAISLTHKVAKRVYAETALRFPARVSCNICGWSGRKFYSDIWFVGTICPRCGSDVRHRLLIATLQRILGLTFDQIVAGKRVLHFAPDSTKRLIQPRAESYLTADFSAPGVDLQLDMTDMPIVGDKTVDLLIACDVLEHVSDFRKALHEIKRVLAPGGWALLTLPQIQGLGHTFEDPTVTSPSERERVFGQNDHLRIFGDDFADVLKSAGFMVRVISARDFPKELVNRDVLFPRMPSPHPLATNDRKVFCASRSL